MRRILLLTIFWVVLSISVAFADERRPIMSEYRLEVGGGYLGDTYLSPLKYTGVAANLVGRWSKMMPFSPQHVSMSFEGELSGSLPKSPARNTTVYDVGMAFSWGMDYHWLPAHDWRITAGASVGLSGSVSYLPVNSNNVVSPHIRAGLSLALSGAWNTHICKLPIVVEDRVSLPSIGAFYTPGFGETFYEIYLGNRHGLAHCGWWGNNFGIDNLLSARFDFGRRSLLVGYRLKIESTWANHLNYQRANHFLVIGFTQ